MNAAKVRLFRTLKYIPATPRVGQVAPGAFFCQRVMSAWTCRRLCNGARHELSSAGRTSPCGFLLAKIKVSVRMKKGDAKGKRHHSSYFFFLCWYEFQEQQLQIA